MQENEFEKKVRKQMDDFGFDPSESVWTAVDRELNPEKKKRRPLFWLFFLSGLTITAGSYYFVTQSRSATHSGNDISLSSPPKPAVDSKSKTALPAASATGSASINTASVSIVSGKKPSDKLINKSHTEMKSMTANAINRKLAVRNSSEPEYPGTRPATQLTDPKAMVQDTENAASLNTSINPPENTDRKMADTATIAKVAQPPVNKPSKDSTTRQTAKSKVKNKKTKSWDWGVTGYAGASNINQSLFKQAMLSGANFAAAAAPPGGTGGQAVTPVIHTGFSFGAGVFARKNLSARFSLSAGLEYHYYSTTVNTGNQFADSSSNSANVLSVPNSTTYFQTGTSQTFTNQYHLIQLPLTAAYRFNNSRKIPLTLEAGLIPSLIIGSHILQYDPSSSVYFKSNQNISHFQWNGSMDVLIGIPGTGTALQAGPQLQYGLTQLMNSGSGQPQHLLFYGLKLVFVPGKK